MSDATPRNRRAFRRLTPKRSTKIACRLGALGGGPNLAVALLDVSETGARLVLKAPLARGQAVQLELEGVWHRRPLALAAQAVWSVPSADGNHVVGLRFDKSLLYSDLQLLAQI